MRRTTAVFLLMTGAALAACGGEAASTPAAASSTAPAPTTTTTTTATATTSAAATTTSAAATTTSTAAATTTATTTSATTANLTTASVSATSASATTTSAPTTSTSVARTTTAQPGVEYAALLPTAEQFPLGYTAVPVDDELLRTYFDWLSGESELFLVEPAECASTNPFAGPDQLAVVEGTDEDGTMLLTVSVGAVGEGLAAVETRIAGCPTVTVTTAEDGAAPVAGEGTQEVLPPPLLDADATLAFRQSLTADLGDGSLEVTLESLTLAAEVGDVVVLVSGEAGPGVTLDTGVLDELLTATVQSVREGS